MHLVSYSRCPAYLTAIVQLIYASRPHLGQRLRSASSTDFSLPQLHTKSGVRAFSHAGPVAWNSLPEHIRAEPDIRVSWKLPKTRLLT